MEDRFGGGGWSRGVRKTSPGTRTQKVRCLKTYSIKEGIWFVSNVVMTQDGVVGLSFIEELLLGVGRDYGSSDYP